MEMNHEQGKVLQKVKNMITIDREAFKNRSSIWNSTQNRTLHQILTIDNNINGLNRTINYNDMEYQRGVIMMHQILKAILQQENKVVQAINSQSALRNDVWKKLFKQDFNLKTIISSFNASLLGVQEKIANQMANISNALLNINDVVRNNVHRLQYMAENMNQTWSTTLMSLKIIGNILKTNIGHKISSFHDLQLKKLVEIEMGEKRIT